MTCAFAQFEAVRRRCVAFEGCFVGVRTHSKMSPNVPFRFEAGWVVWGYD